MNKIPHTTKLNWITDTTGTTDLLILNEHDLICSSKLVSENTLSIIIYHIGKIIYSQEIEVLAVFNGYTGQSIIINYLIENDILEDPLPNSYMRKPYMSGPTGFESINWENV